jgi:cold shock CspA family protein
VNNAFKKFFGEGEAPTEPDTTPIRPDERRVIGKVIKVSDAGWGFISSKDIKFTRIFFHWTSLKQDTLRFQDLKNGMLVEFTPVDVAEKGWRAIKIRVIKKDEPKP